MTDISTVVTLPTPLTPLIGRDRELALLQKALRQPVRLLTITGIGGIGKTRLAIQLLLEMEPDIPGGVVAVPLAEQRDADHIPAEIAARLGHIDPNLDIDALVTLLGPDERLLLLDNLEQIPRAGEVIALLLQKHRGLTVIGTSQVPLDVPGEQIFALEPMELPTVAANAPADVLRHSPAVALFIHRARTADANLEFNDAQVDVIADICRTLEGIPLAIELAAARITVLTLEDLRSRLNRQLDVLEGGSRYAPDRQRTMRKATAWTYNLLPADEQRMFRFLGVYAGNISIEAIAHTINTLESTTSPLEMLAFLNGRSLVRRMPTTNGAPRYHMLQTLREFVQEQLTADGDDYQAQLSRARYVLDRAKTAEPQLVGESQAHWLALIDADLENIRAAMSWSVDNDPEIALAIIASLWRYFGYRGISHQFLGYAQKAVARLDPARVSARAWLGKACMEHHIMDLEGANLSNTRALEIARAAGDHLSEQRAMVGLGQVAMARLDLDAARSWLQQAAATAETHGDTRGAIVSLASIASIHVMSGDYESAKNIYIDVLDKLAPSGDKANIALIYSNIGAMCNELGQHQIARDYLQRSVAINREINNQVVLGHSLNNIAHTSAELGDIDAALAYVEEAVELAQKSNQPTLEAEFRTNYANYAYQNGHIAPALHHLVLAAGLSAHEGSTRPIVNGAGVLFQILMQMNRYETAARLLGAIVPLREQIAFPSYPVQRSLEAELEAMMTSKRNDSLRLAASSSAGWTFEDVRLETIRLCREVLEATLASGEETIGTGEEEPAPVPASNLTAREHEVLALLVKGLTNQEIAEAMFISPRTISTHVSNILAKLEVRTRSAAVAFAMNAGIV